MRRSRIWRRCANDQNGNQSLAVARGARRLCDDAYRRAVCAARRLTSRTWRPWCKVLYGQVRLHLMVRQLTAVILSTLMLQLNFKQSDLACSKHDREPSATRNSAPHHDMAMPGHDQQRAGEQKSCEIPATRYCCQTVASCAMNFGLAVDARGTADLAGHHNGSLARARIPASLVTAPEPPPPRA